MPLLLAIAFLTLVLLLGGGTRQGLAADQVLQFAALPVLWVVGMRLRRSHLEGDTRLALLCVLSMLAWFALQLLPLPPALWLKLPQRAAMAADLASAGVALGWRPISVDALVTTRALLAWLPPLALGMLVLELGAHQRVRVMQAMVLLAVLATLIGFAQLAGGQHSPLRWHAFTNTLEAVGPFANRNHLASLLVMALPLAAAWIVDVSQRSSPRTRASRRHAVTAVVIGIVVLLLVGVAVTRSRAGIVLAALAVLMSAALAWRSRDDDGMPQHGRSARRGLALAGLLGLVLAIQYGFVGLLDRLQDDAFDDVRWRIAATTIDAARALAPTGAGLGTFVDAYVQFEPADQRTEFLVNRAHNDWAEWALGGGLPLLVLLVFALVLLTRATLRAWHDDDDHASWRRAAACAIWLVLLHSLVDYPLRTTALSTVTAALLALLFARRGERARPH